MKAYLDSSVVLRVVIGQANRLDAWDEIEHAVTSALTEVECLRTLDRLRLRGGIDASALAVRREAVYRLLGAMEVVEIGRAVIARAGQPYSTPLGTLDAVHLSTALLWADDVSRCFGGSCIPTNATSARGADISLSIKTARRHQ